jgi:hypothetical protein
MADSLRDAAGDPGESGEAAINLSPGRPSGLGPDEALGRFAESLASAPPTVAEAFSNALSIGLQNAVARQQADGDLANAMLSEICARLLRAQPQAAAGEETGPGPQPVASAQPEEGQSVADAAAGRAQPPAIDAAAAHDRPNPAALAFAQTEAILVQDAADSLRHACIIANCFTGIALERFVETGDPEYLKGLDQVDRLIAQATFHFKSKVFAAQETQFFLVASSDATD